MKKIFSLALILSIITFGNTGSIMAQSLTDALNNSDTILDFSGSTVTDSNLGAINTSDYISENSTTYIGIDTIPIQHFTGRGG